MQYVMCTYIHYIYSMIQYDYTKSWKPILTSALDGPTLRCVSASTVQPRIHQPASCTLGASGEVVSLMPPGYMQLLAERQSAT